MSAHSTPEYRDVPGFPGYRVGSDGSVWTCKLKGGNDRTPGRIGPWRRLSMHRNRAGYLLVNLDKGGKNHTRMVHAIVLTAFVGPRPDGMEACHYPDPDKNNNRLGNLRWDTHGENAKDRYRGRPPTTEKLCRGCGQTKPAAEFCRDRRASDGMTSRCKSCHYEQVKRTRDPEKKRAYNREWMRRKAAK